MSYFRAARLVLLGAALGISACTLHHSKQAMWTSGQAPPSADAKFVTEEDSGLSLLGVFEVAEPDHYAVLLERARRRYSCQRIHHAQLDFYTDYWLIISFPISRLTLICDQGPPPGKEPAGAKLPSKQPPQKPKPLPPKSEPAPVSPPPEPADKADSEGDGEAEAGPPPEGSTSEAESQP